MILSEQRLSKMWRSGLAVAGFAALAIVLAGPLAAAQEAAVKQVKGMSPQLSEKIRKQILEKLVQGTHHADADVANDILAVSGPVADAEMATQALVPILDKPALTKEEMLEKLHFSCCLLAHGLAREKVVASVMEAATTSEHAAVRFRAINVLLFAGPETRRPTLCGCSSRPRKIPSPLRVPRLRTINRAVRRNRTGGPSISL